MLIIFVLYINKRCYARVSSRFGITRGRVHSFRNCTVKPMLDLPFMSRKERTRAIEIKIRRHLSLRRVARLCSTTNVPRFLLAVTCRPTDTLHHYAEELSKELQLPDAAFDEELGDFLDGEAGRVSVSVRDVRQRVPASGHLGQAHQTRVRQGAAVQVSLLHPQNQAARQSLSTHSNQSSRQERLLEQYLTSFLPSSLTPLFPVSEPRQRVSYLLSSGVAS